MRANNRYGKESQDHQVPSCYYALEGLSPKRDCRARLGWAAPPSAPPAFSAPSAPSALRPPAYPYKPPAFYAPVRPLRSPSPMRS